MFSDITDVHRRYLSAMLEAQDRAVGQVLDTLAQEGIRDNTLVVYLSDNGGERAPHVDNRPLRGSKFTIYEGGLRVPFMLSWPSQWWARPRVTDKLVSSLDIAPTLLRAAGITSSSTFDGEELQDIVDGGNRRSALFFRYGLEWAMIDGGWKCFQQLDPKTFELRQVLYNLNSDIGETTDVSAQHSAQVADMEQSFMEWSTGFKAPLWGIMNLNATTLALYRHEQTGAYRVVRLDYLGRILESRDIGALPLSPDAKVGRCKTGNDIDIASIEGSRITLRSMNFDGGPISTQSVHRNDAVAILGFADFNRDGIPEIVSRASDGIIHTDQIAADGVSQIGASLKINVDLTEYHRVLGFADMGGPDSGPDMIAANDRDNVIVVYFRGKQGIRTTNYMFMPRAGTVTPHLARRYVGAVDADGNQSADLFNGPDDVQSSIWFTDRLRTNPKCETVLLDPIWRPVSAGSGDLPVPGGE
jgi:hypothetical protein